MRAAVVQLANGLAFGVREATTPAEEEAGLDVYGPRDAMLFSRPGPVSLARTLWPLDLIWLARQSLGSDYYVVELVRGARPGTYGYGARRAESTRLLEVPSSWRLAIAPGDAVRVVAR